MKGIVLGGTNSGVGKTVTTLAVIRALESAGYDVQPAKAGPDFIDPSHHSEIAGKPSRTLDLWLEGEAGMRRNYHRGEGDICVVEGVMGLYDGDASSTATVAAALDLPVVLVVDAKAGMESVAATALGFKEYADRIGRDIDVAGVIAQRAHGGRHASGIEKALPDELAYFGRIPPDEALEIPDRHLGLQMGTEQTVPEKALDEAAETIATEQLVDSAKKAAPPKPAEDTEATDSLAGQAEPTIAVARDSAFCFVYPATVERLQSSATVETFSPVAGDEVPDADGVYLPGGYPELHLDELAESDTLSSLAGVATEGTPIVGECGGLMVLTERLTSADGNTEPMAGVLPATVEMRDRYQALDHVELRARKRSPVAERGDCRRGHEFHYSQATVGRDAQFAFDVERGEGLTGESDGLVEYQTVGLYCHSHAVSGAFDVFLRRAAELSV